MSISKRLIAASLLIGVAALPIRAGAEGEADAASEAGAASETGAADEASLEILRDTLRSNKKAIVDVNLALTDAEASAFWPVYDRYQQELKAVHDRLLRVIDDYAASFDGMTDEKAMQLVDDYLAAERDRVEVRRAYREPIAKALPGRKLMRFYQIENKIDAVLRYELAATIPVVEQ
ncbi:MAG TPA: hypothetical protein VEC18_07855 [Myxococcota bacterium]|nr:hypothetical protein [Myxococcota bacterium]